MGMRPEREIEEGRAGAGGLRGRPRHTPSLLKGPQAPRPETITKKAAFLAAYRELGVVRYAAKPAGIARELHTDGAERTRHSLSSSPKHMIEHPVERLTVQVIEVEDQPPKIISDLSTPYTPTLRVRGGQRASVLPRKSQ